jgi:hypothetical protein
MTYPELKLLRWDPYLPARNIHQLHVEYFNGLQVDIRIPNKNFRNPDGVDEWEFYYHGEGHIILYIYKNLKEADIDKPSYGLNMNYILRALRTAFVSYNKARQETILEAMEEAERYKI